MAWPFVAQTGAFPAVVFRHNRNRWDDARYRVLLFNV